MSRKKLIKKTELLPQNIISNNIFTGVKWDIESLELLKIIGQGLLNMTELFRSQNVTIESLLKINPDNKKIDSISK